MSSATASVSMRMCFRPAVWHASNFIRELQTAMRIIDAARCNHRPAVNVAIELDEGAVRFDAAIQLAKEERDAE